jgi:hypothetical protein
MTARATSLDRTTIGTPARVLGEVESVSNAAGTQFQLCLNGVSSTKCAVHLAGKAEVRQGDIVSVRGNVGADGCSLQQAVVEGHLEKLDSAKYLAHNQMLMAGHAALFV